MNAQIMQLVVNQIGHGALPASAKTGEPDHASVVAIELFSLTTRNARGMPDDVGLLGQGTKLRQNNKQTSQPRGCDIANWVWN